MLIIPRAPGPPPFRRWDRGGWVPGGLNTTGHRVGDGTTEPKREDVFPVPSAKTDLQRRGAGVRSGSSAWVSRPKPDAPVTGLRHVLGLSRGMFCFFGGEIVGGWSGRWWKGR